jgi:phosphatidylinositol-3-phosphatase
MRPRLILPGLAACRLATGRVSAGQASAMVPYSGRVSAAATVPSFGHVFVIVGENKSLFQLNSSDAPYIMNTLKPSGAWFTDYNDVTEGSLADYVALTSGQYASYHAGYSTSRTSSPS